MEDYDEKRKKNIKKEQMYERINEYEQEEKKDFDFIKSYQYYDLYRHKTAKYYKCFNKERK